MKQYMNRERKIGGKYEKKNHGNVELIASKMNGFFVSVSEHLPRLDTNNEAIYVDG